MKSSEGQLAKRFKAHPITPSEDIDALPAGEQEELNVLEKELMQRLRSVRFKLALGCSPSAHDVRLGTDTANEEHENPGLDDQDRNPATNIVRANLGKAAYLGRAMVEDVRLLSGLAACKFRVDNDALLDFWISYSARCALWWA